MLLFNYLDEYILDYIYFIVWYDKYKIILNELKHTTPHIYYKHGGSCWSINYSKSIKNINKSCH